MITTLAAILAIVFTWIIYAAACIGLGAWYPWIVRKQAAHADIFAAFWAGLVTLLAILQFWHFAAPITFVTQITLLSIGLLAFFCFLPKFLADFKSTPPRHLRRAVLAAILLLIWLANRATGPDALYDAGLYHIPMLNWTEHYAIVPGLANLHMRFGFSSTLILLAAAMDQGPWAGQAAHLANGFFLAAFAVMLIRSISVILTAERASAQHWLLLFCGVALVDWGIDIQASSYSTDLGTVILSLMAAYYFLQTLASGENGLLAILLLATAITAKASALVLSVPLITVLLVLFWRKNPGHRFAAVLPPLLAIAALIIPWLIRQTILSGYPLFPSELLALNVDWKVPYEKVLWLRRIMLDFARWGTYDDTRHTAAWFPIWFKSRILPTYAIWKCAIPVAIALIALILAAIRRAISKFRLHTSDFRLGPLLLLASSILAIIIWYNSSPDPRYIAQAFMLLMASAFLLAIGIPRPRLRRPLVIAACLFALGPIFLGSIEVQNQTRSLAGVWLLPPPPPDGFFYPTPTTQTVPMSTPSGLIVYVPQTRPGEKPEDRVWNAPLPNAPRSEIEVQEVQIPELRLRHPPDLQSGFTRQ